MPFYLEYLGYSVVLSEGEVVVGRDVSCSLRFNDAAVSRRHMRFVCTNEMLEVEDLGSMNGTIVNGRPIVVRTLTPLADGDSVEIGGYRLKVRIVDEEADQASTRRLTTLFELGNLQRPRRAAPTSRPATTRRSARPTMQPGERRRHDRLSIELSLVYSSATLELEVTSRDLSVSGVFVSTEVLDPVGTACELTFLLDGAPPLHVRGVVRRVSEAKPGSAEPPGLGIELLKMGEAERSWIEAAIQREVMTGPIAARATTTGGDDSGDR